MGAGDSMSPLLVQVCVISPALSWILRPGRFSRRRGFVYAVSFLALVAAATVGMDFYEQEGNFYHVVGVGRDASAAEVKRAFRLRSVELHPDKNPAPTAVEDFNRLRLAFDVLGDASKRVVYDLFGERAVDKELGVVQTEAAIGTLSFYAVWAVITFVLTLSDAAREARAWALAGGVLWFVLELNLIFGGATLPSRLFPRMTVFEFARVLRAAFPPFINGCRAIGGYFHRSLAQENFALGVELLKTNQAILLGMRQLQGEVASSSRRRPEAVKPDALPPAARKRLKMDKHPAVASASDAAPSSMAAPMADVQEALNPQPQVQKPPGFAIPSFVYFIGFYFVMNYFFK